MRSKSYRIVHKNEPRDQHTLNDKQIQHEYDELPRMVGMLFKSSRIKENCEKIVGSVIITLEGDVTEAELDSAVKQILQAVNTEKVQGRSGQPNFVIAAE